MSLNEVFELSSLLREEYSDTEGVRRKAISLEATIKQQETRLQHEEDQHQALVEEEKNLHEKVEKLFDQVELISATIDQFLTNTVNDLEVEASSIVDKVSNFKTKKQNLIKIINAMTEVIEKLEESGKSAKDQIFRKGRIECIREVNKRIEKADYADTETRMHLENTKEEILSADAVAVRVERSCEKINEATERLFSQMSSESDRTQEYCSEVDLEIEQRDIESEGIRKVDSEYKDAIERYTAEQESLLSNIQHYQEEFDRETEAMRCLCTEIDLLVEKKETLLKICDTINLQKLDLESRLTKEECDDSSLKKSLVESRQKLDGERCRRDYFDDRATGLKDNGDKTSAEVDSFKGRLIEVETMIQEKENQINGTRPHPEISKLQGEIDERDHRLCDQKRSITDTIASKCNLTSDIHELRSNIEVSAKEANGLKESLGQLKDDIEGLKSRIQSLTDRSKSLATTAFLEFSEQNEKDQLETLRLQREAAQSKLGALQEQRLAKTEELRSKEDESINRERQKKARLLDDEKTLRTKCRKEEVDRETEDLISSLKKTLADDDKAFQTFCGKLNKEINTKEDLHSKNLQKIDLKNHELCNNFSQLNTELHQKEELFLSLQGDCPP